MKERPILFSGEMVRAILDGRKTMTRRVVKPQPPEWCTRTGVSELTPPCAWEFRGTFGDEGPACKFIRCPYLPVSETRLWVRETWGQSCDKDSCGLVCYAADRTAYHILCDCDGEGDAVGHGWKHYAPLTAWEHIRWRPSIHMPRWASRITLQLKSVRAERLQEITADDIAAEGFPPDDGPPRDGTRLTSAGRRLVFAELWDSLNARRGFSWDQNPWVWVVRFKQADEAELGKKGKR